MVLSSYIRQGKKMSKKINIYLKINGEGRLQCPNLGTFKCLGKPGYVHYPKSTITIRPNNSNEKQRIHFSGEYVDQTGNPYKMEFCLMINFQYGVYIHAGANNLRENGGVSAGCIHLKREDAQRVFNWVTEKTLISVKTAW